MKKIFFLFAAVSLLFACDPTHEDIKIGGNITADELKAMSSVTVDKAENGQNGNVITCTTTAPVNAMWSIGGKEFTSNYATKKMKLGEYTVTLTGLCADGTIVKADFPVKCEVITNQLNRYYIYGEPGSGQEPFKPGSWDASQMRFSDNEGKHLPYLTDEVYFGLKTLILDISEVEDNTNCKIMTGWWSPVFFEDFDVKKAIGGKAEGLWELQLTDEMAKACAKGGEARDLDLMLKSGNFTLNSVYYEE